MGTTAETQTTEEQAPVVESVETTDSTEQNNDEAFYKALATELEADESDTSEEATPEATPVATEVKTEEAKTEQTPAPAQAQQPAQPEATPAPVTTPAQQPTPQQPAQAAQPAQPAPQPTPEATPQPTAQKGPLTSEQIQEAYKAYEGEFLPKLEKAYALTEEQAEALTENLQTELPKLMARVHYNAQMSAYTGVMTQIPVIVEQMMEQSRSIQAAEDRFFGRWPSLKKPEYQSQIMTTLQAYRNANPKATPEDVIEKAGVMAMITLGLDPNEGTAAAAQPQAAQPHPSASRPAGVHGSGAARPAERGAVGFWEGLAEEIMADDLD